MLKLSGRAINAGEATGEAFVLDTPFSFIGDFDPDTGKFVAEGHPLKGQSLAGKILVCPTGKGGTIAPFIAYQAQKKGLGPKAILCTKAEPILCECALVTDIPILDGFDQNPVETIKFGQKLVVKGAEVFAEA